MQSVICFPTKWPTAAILYFSKTILELLTSGVNEDRNVYMSRNQLFFD